MTELQWFDRTGRPLEKIAETARFDSPALSPDGRRVVVTRFEPGTFAQQVWTIDLETGVSSPRTFGPGFGKIAVWSPDAHDMVFSVMARTGAELNRRAADSGSEVHLLEPGAHYSAFPTDWTRDGESLIYQAQSPNYNGSDLFAYDFQAGRTRPIVQAIGNQVQGRVSPDKKWLAYATQETGSMNVFVQSYTSAGIKVQVTTEGGSQPLWSRDGKELFYLAADNTLMAVPVRGERAFGVGKAVRLFVTRAPNLLAPFWTQYTVSPDGQRFLVNNVVPDAAPTTITIVLNWKP
jgi:Tol biopolymer transport system component